jgi:diphosphomevalonate decarboxylase
MMKATAKAPANIAFIKYWGKADEKLRLPLNASISMNLSDTYTVTTVEFLPELAQDNATLLNGEFSENETERIKKSLNFVRNKANIKYSARVTTKNTFPKGAGAAASASGFSALTVAAFTAVGLKLSEKELTVFSRLGSGSACRSVPDGFVEWKKGTTSDTSYAYSLYPHGYWDLRDILVIVDYHMKKVSTTEGMMAVRKSPFLPARLGALPGRIVRIKNAMQQKNFQQLGEIIEEECMDVHHVMQTQKPPLFYWNDITKTIINTVACWRKAGVPVYFTIDAGPNVHLICEGKDVKNVVRAVKKIQGMQKIIVNKPSKGAHLVNTHLF